MRSKADETLVIVEIRYCSFGSHGRLEEESKVGFKINRISENKCKIETSSHNFKHSIF